MRTSERNYTLCLGNNIHQHFYFLDNMHVVREFQYILDIPLNSYDCFYGTKDISDSMFIFTYVGGL